MNPFAEFNRWLDHENLIFIEKLFFKWPEKGYLCPHKILIAFNWPAQCRPQECMYKYRCTWLICFNNLPCKWGEKEVINKQLTKPNHYYTTPRIQKKKMPNIIHFFYNRILSNNSSYFHCNIRIPILRKRFLF